LRCACSGAGSTTATAGGGNGTTASAAAAATTTQTPRSLTQPWMTTTRASDATQRGGASHQASRGASSMGAEALRAQPRWFMRSRCERGAPHQAQRGALRAVFEGMLLAKPTQGHHGGLRGDPDAHCSLICTLTLSTEMAARPSPSTAFAPAGIHPESYMFLQGMRPRPMRSVAARSTQPFINFVHFVISISYILSSCTTL